MYGVRTPNPRAVLHLNCNIIELLRNLQSESRLNIKLHESSVVCARQHFRGPVLAKHKCRRVVSNLRFVGGSLLSPDCTLWRCQDQDKCILHVDVNVKIPRKILHVGCKAGVCGW